MAIALFWQHTVSIENYLGSGSHGPVYGTARSVVGFLEHKKRLIRTTNTAEVVASSTLYASAAESDVPVDSRVTTADGKVSRVIDFIRHDSGTLPLPEHIEVVLE